MKKKLRFMISVTSLIIFLGNLANAAIVTYDAQEAFFADLSALNFVDQQTLNFENQIAGNLIPSGSTVENVTFTYTIPGDQIQIGNSFDTTSSPNYIGLNNTEGAFIYGDSFTMTFDRIIHAVGLYLIAETETVLAGDFELSTPAGNVQNSGDPDPGASLPRDEAFFIGLIETDFNLGFSSADLAGLLDPEEVNYVFTVDDITFATNPVPLPTTLMLFGTGLVIFIGIRRKYNI